MTTVDQAKQDRNTHWDSCEECTPPMLTCAEGRRLHDVLVGAVNAVNSFLLPL